MIYLLPLTSFIVALILTPWLKNLAIKYRLFDEPSKDELKIHKKPIPYLGGIGIFLGFTISLIIAYLLDQISEWQTVGIILGSAVIISLGLWDDFKGEKALNPILRLLLQFLAGFLIVFILIKIGINFNLSISPLVATIVAAFYIIGAMNALNMEDGIDGLAGGLTVISLIGFFILSSLGNNILPLILSLSLLGGTIGFLIYNWHPASIFMGDNGSHFLGFCLAVLAIIFTSHPVYNLKQFIGPILIIGLPVIDAAWAIIRRSIKGKSPFQGDRGHLYDRLHQKGLSIKKTVLFCYGIQIIIVGIGVIIYYL